MVRSVAALIVIVVVAMIPAFAAVDDGASQATVQAVREAGVAMWFWLAEQLPTGEPSEDEALTAARAVTPDPNAWEHCSEISSDELAELVVPKYIAELPTKDAWGHDLQFCLTFDRADPTRYLMAVRSPGRDGSFSEAAYETGPFPASSADEDIVWIQGYFVRWPKK